MSYTLEGREIPDAAPGDDVGRAPCIFCGRVIGHWNDGSVGWILGAIVDGKPKNFLYCDQPPCPKALEEGDKDIWRCGCEYDYVENVGDECHMCRRSCADAVRVANS